MKQPGDLYENAAARNAGHCTCWDLEWGRTGRLVDTMNCELCFWSELYKNLGLHVYSGFQQMPKAAGQRRSLSFAAAPQLQSCFFNVMAFGILLSCTILVGGRG